MANVTAVYCMRSKKDRQDVGKYRELVELIDRYAAQGTSMGILGLFEAKKAFRCESLDPSESAFRIAKGEYFLLVDCKDYDATLSRLQRACRSGEYSDIAWPLIGLPDDERVYGGDAHLESVDVGLPQEIEEEEIAANEVAESNYITVYTISEATPTDSEMTWGIVSYREKDFADAPEILPLFRKFVRCHRVEEIEALENRDALISHIVKMYEKRTGKPEKTRPHHSVVIGVIDGRTDYWNCGVWCYKRVDDFTINPVQYFCPSGYEVDPEIGYIPIFD